MNKKIPKKEKSSLYQVFENVPLVDSDVFKNKVCEILVWTEKQWRHRYYSITPITNAEIALVRRLFLAYKNDKDLFFSSTFDTYNYQNNYKEQS